MMSRALILLLAVQATALPQFDPYAPPPPAGSAERLAYDAAFGGPKEDAAVEAWLRAHPDAPPAQRALLYHALCNHYGVVRGGEARVAACAQAQALAPTEEAASDLKIAEAFRSAPPLSASGGASVALIDNPLRSKSVEVSVNGITMPWFFDTGAEITTVPESTAAKMGVRFVEGTVDVGTSTSNRVVGKLGLIDRLVIGGATVRNLPVFILPDAMLTLTEDYTIPGILGLPAMAALGRIAWTEGGKRLLLGDQVTALRGKTARVHWHEGGLGVPIATPLGTASMHFDSGADKTTLRPLGLKLLTPEQAASAVETHVGTGGAGGVVISKAKVLPRFDYALAGIPLHASEVTIEQRNESAGRVGSDMIVQLRSLTIDFATMTLAAEPLRP